MLGTGQQTGAQVGNNPTGRNADFAAVDTSGETQQNGQMEDARKTDLPVQMDTQNEPASGGCQCGSVRFSIARLGKASICHCRMCQKAFGGLFAPLVEAHDITWTRGERAIFHSSKTNWRGYCRDCGTPLTYEFEGVVEVAIGALDQPDLAQPVVQVNAGYRRACFDGLAKLPEKPSTLRDADEAWNRIVSSNQHPDHDT